LAKSASRWEKERKKAHTVLASNPMRAAPQVEPMSATADPAMSMCPVGLEEAEKSGRGRP